MKDSLLLVFANKQDVNGGKSKHLVPLTPVGGRIAQRLGLCPAGSFHQDTFGGLTMRDRNHSHEAARSHRGPEPLKIERQGLVRCAQLRDDGRGLARGPGLAVQQRQGTACPGQEVDDEISGECLPHPPLIRLFHDSPTHRQLHQAHRLSTPSHLSRSVFPSKECVPRHPTFPIRIRRGDILDPQQPSKHPPRPG